MQQRFYFEYQPEGFYKVTAMHTGKSITVLNNEIKKGAQIIQYDYQGLNSQKWILRDSHKNGWVISPLNNPNLSISVNGNIENGSKLILSETEDNNKQMFYVIKYVDKNIIEGIYGNSGLIYKGTGGNQLKYYKIENGKKHLFLAFAIHGFEDSYYRDGQELTYIADELFNYLKKYYPDDYIEKYTVYIFPSLNPDGEYNGWDNDGPGRTTLYSWAQGNVGIDMNRCFPVGYKSIKDRRNYNGEQPLQAYEAEAIRDFILNHSGTQNIVIDVHGWLNETIGDYEIGQYYRNEFNINNHIYSYGNGYFINWARTVPNTRSMLLELPNINSHRELVQNGYVNKFINGTLNLLKNY